MYQLSCGKRIDRREWLKVGEGAMKREGKKTRVARKMVFSFSLQHNRLHTGLTKLAMTMFSQFGIEGCVF